MNATLLAVVLCLASAVAYASAAVAQERLARASADTARERVSRSAGRLLGSGAWWWSAGLNTAAALLHAAALRYGPLTLVQPLGALTLVAAVPLGARRAGRRVAPTEWRGTLATVAGLGLLLLPASGPAPDDTLTLAEALAVSGATSAAVLLLTVRTDPGSGLRHATASGLASAAASALTQTVAVAAGRGGALLSARVGVVALLVVVFAVGGMLLSQRAYRGGLGAPLAVVNLANPLAAAAIGTVLLGERLQGGVLGLLLAGGGAAAAARGVLLLTRTPSSAAAGEAPAPTAALAPAPAPARPAPPLPVPVRTATAVGAFAPARTVPPPPPGGRTVSAGTASSWENA
ncbi:DMT family transporter [Streptomyces sp. NPDC055254]